VKRFNDFCCFLIDFIKKNQNTRRILITFHDQKRMGPGASFMHGNDCSSSADITIDNRVKPGTRLGTTEDGGYAAFDTMEESQEGMRCSTNH